MCSQPERSVARGIVISVRLSEAEAALVDAARGADERGAWIREVALAAATPAPKRNPKNCKHEGMKLHRGWCPDCESMAVKK
jgi:hypothetical protein